MDRHAAPVHAVCPAAIGRPVGADRRAGASREPSSQRRQRPGRGHVGGLLPPGCHQGRGVAGAVRRARAAATRSGAALRPGGFDLVARAPGATVPATRASLQQAQLFRGREGSVIRQPGRVGPGRWYGATTGVGGALGSGGARAAEAQQRGQGRPRTDPTVRQTHDPDIVSRRSGPESGVCFAPVSSYSQRHSPR